MAKIPTTPKKITCPTCNGKRNDPSKKWLGFPRICQTCNGNGRIPCAIPLKPRT